MANDQITPGRKTHVKFDVAELATYECAFSLERQSHQMVRTKIAARTNVEYRRGIGWTLSNYVDQYGFTAERTEGQAGILGPGTMEVATGVTQRYLFRSPTELTGATSGANANLASQALPAFRKDVAGGDSFAVNLAADQAAFPSPDTSNDTIVMDRIAATVASYGPDDEAWTATFAISFTLPGTNHSSPDAVDTFYFPGPAGNDDQGKGIGQYAVKHYGNGRAKLLEYTGSAWLKRASFQWATPHNVMGFTHGIRITVSNIFAAGSGPGGSITIQSDSTFAGRGLGESIVALAMVGIGYRDEVETFVYAVPRIDSISTPTTSCPIRLDIRRDLRAYFSILVPQYFTSGSFTDDPFCVPGFFSFDQDYVLQWDAHEPTGTTLDLKLYDSTGTELTVTSSGPNYKYYQTPTWGTDPKQEYHVKATFTTSDVAKTPVLKAWKCYRDGISQLVDNGEWEPSNVVSVTITGAERDPSHEAATLEIKDVLNASALLRTRASIPIQIETEYDLGDATKRCILFRGYAYRTNSKRRGTQGNVYPSANWNDMTVEGFGMWQRLSEQVFANVQQQFFDYVAGQPSLVTDVLTAMLGWGGFPSEMVDITPSDVRIWGNGTDNAMVLEPLANLADTIQQLVRDYLGQFLIFDPNIGTYGKWRTIAPPVAPYTNIAAFVTGPPPAGTKVSVSASAAYPNATTGGGLTYASGSPTTFVIKGTQQSFVKPPEANFVHVSAVGNVGTQGVSAKFDATLINPISYNFYPDTPTADPTHPDYLGRMVPIYVMNSALIGSGKSDEDYSNATNWVARRIYDVACHAIKMYSFEAPLILIPHELDATKKRPLRYYDPVTVDGVQYLVRNVNPVYRKDSVQLAMYELEAPRF